MRSDVSVRSCELIISESVDLVDNQVFFILSESDKHRDMLLLDPRFYV